MEEKLEDSRRKMRYVEHQFAIIKGVLLLPLIVNIADGNSLSLSLSICPLVVCNWACGMLRNSGSLHILVLFLDVLAIEMLRYVL